MTKSMPLSAKGLGISFEEYEEIARNIHRVSLLPKESREHVLRRASEVFSQDEAEEIAQLQEEMAYDRRVYQLAGLSYAEGPPRGEDLFVTGIVDYLMRRNLERTLNYVLGRI